MMTKLEAIKERNTRDASFGEPVHGEELARIQAREAIADRAFLLKLTEYARHDDSDDGHICGTRLNRPCDCGLAALLEQTE